MSTPRPALRLVSRLSVLSGKPFAAAGAALDAVAPPNAVGVGPIAAADDAGPIAVGRLRAAARLAVVDVLVPKAVVVALASTAPTAVGVGALKAGVGALPTAVAGVVVVLG